MPDSTYPPTTVNAELTVYLPMERRHALLHEREIPDRVQGAALFADVSGFTVLTERLVAELGAQRGPEELIRIINQVYDALIDEVHAYRGSVIAFAGDAITCWFDGDDGRRAAAAALAMQMRMQDFRAVETPGGATVRLSMKASVTAGPARRFLVGDPEQRVIEALAGATITRLAYGEGLAQAGEVLVDESIWRTVGSDLVADETRRAASGDRFHAVRRLIDPVSPTSWSDLAIERLREELLRCWLLPVIYARLQQGLGHFLTELRPTVALFVRFGGIDYDADDAAGTKLDRFIRFVQEVVARHAGTLIDLNIGDKGSYLYLNFGAPFAHENDADRAAFTALDLLAGAGEFDYLEPLQIGISQGRMRAGAYGATTHRTYGVLGDEVNMAARLMMAAEPGQILISDTAQRYLGAQFELATLPPRRVKGRERPINLFRLIGARSTKAAGLALPEQTLPFVGRQAELASLRQMLDAAQTSQGSVISITGEAGLGKTRLVEEAIRIAQTQGLRWLGGECDSYGVNASYLVWRPIWRQLFGLTENDPLDAQIAAITGRLAAINPRLVRRAPLLGPVLNLPIPDNNLTRSLDARARKVSLEGLLIECLQVESAQAPLLLVLEDCQWLDPVSYDLVESIATAIDQLNLALILAYRPLEMEAARSDRIARLDNHTEIIVQALNDEEARALIRAKFGQVDQDAKDISAALVDKIVDQAEGNPFYTEELINFLHYRNIDPGDAQAVDQLVLPSSLHQLVLSRIDQLTEHQKITVKVASVVGRSFRADWLWNAFRELSNVESVEDDLQALTQRELTMATPQENGSGYIFRHAVTQGVAYESLPFVARQEFHERFAHYIEVEYASQLDQYVTLLAYHYTQSSNQEKMRVYLLRAGEAAQREYANASAIDFYDRLLPLLEDAEKIQVMRKLGGVLQVVGRWEEAQTQFDAALTLAQQMDDAHEIGAVSFALAEHFRRQGDYRATETYLIRAQEVFRRDDDGLGVARTHSTAGTLAAQQGHYALAREHYQQALDILRDKKERTLVANVLNNMAIVARFQGDYDRSRELHEEALSIRRELGDPLNISTSLGNLGNVMLDLDDPGAARRYQEEALALRREIGDRWATANALNNLANVLRMQRDYAGAQAMYQESLRINRQLGDRWAIAYLLEDMGALAAAQEAGHQALCMVSAAAKLRGEIGAPRSQAEEEKLNRELQSVYAQLTAEQIAAACAHGEEMVIDDLVACVLDEKKPPPFLASAANH